MYWTRLYYLIKLHDTKTYYNPVVKKYSLYYLIKLHDTKTISHLKREQIALYYLIKLHDTKTLFIARKSWRKLYYLIKLHDTKTSNSCDFVSFDRKYYNFIGIDSYKSSSIDNFHSFGNISDDIFDSTSNALKSSIAIKSNNFSSSDLDKNLFISTKTIKSVTFRILSAFK